MPRQDKIDAVAEFKERVENSRIVVSTKYIGVNVQQVTDLRRQLREKGVQFKVYKNTLVQRALDELGLSEATRFMEGPTAWAFCDDPTVPTKVLKDFSADVPAVEMNGGILNGEVVSGQQLVALADLPSREVLLAQVVGTIAAPLRNCVGVLNALPRNLVNVLDQIRKQREEGAEAA